MEVGHSDADRPSSQTHLESFVNDMELAKEPNIQGVDI